MVALSICMMSMWFNILVVHKLIILFLILRSKIIVEIGPYWRYSSVISCRLVVALSTTMMSEWMWFSLLVVRIKMKLLNSGLVYLFEKRKSSQSSSFSSYNPIIYVKDNESDSEESMKFCCTHRLTGFRTQIFIPVDTQHLRIDFIRSKLE